MVAQRGSRGARPGPSPGTIRLTLPGGVPRMTVSRVVRNVSLRSPVAKIDPILGPELPSPGGPTEDE